MALRPDQVPLHPGPIVVAWAMAELYEPTQDSGNVASCGAMLLAEVTSTCPVAFLASIGQMAYTLALARALHGQATLEPGKPRAAFWPAHLQQMVADGRQALAEECNGSRPTRRPDHPRHHWPWLTTPLAKSWPTPAAGPLATERRTEPQGSGGTGQGAVPPHGAPPGEPQTRASSLEDCLRAPRPRPPPRDRPLSSPREGQQRPPRPRRPPRPAFP